MLAEVCDRLLFSTTLFLIVFAPLSYGAVEPWALNIIRGAVLLMLGVWFLMLAIRRTVNSKSFRLPFVVPACLLLGLILFQLIPFPPAWRDSLSLSPADVSALVRPGIGSNTWSSITLDPKGTREGLTNLAVYLIFCVVLFNACREREKVGIVLFTLIALGAFEALYGLIEYWTGHQHIFWYKKIFFTQEVTGTYINHNHYAGLLGMILPLAVGAFVIEFSRRPVHHLEGFSVWLRAIPFASLLGLIALLGSIGLMLVSLILSHSRGGMISSAVAIVCLAFFLRKAKRTSESGLFRIGLLFAVLGGIVTASFTPIIISRFSYTIRDAPQRVRLWTDGLRIARDFPLWGTGLGTFKQVIPRYRSESDFLTVEGIPQPASWEYAHNDYLQLLIECGIVGCSLAAWALVGTLRRLLPGLARCRNWEDSVLGYSFFCGVIALLVHSIVDFNLHIPANALLFSALLSLSLVIAQDGLQH